MPFVFRLINNLETSFPRQHNLDNFIYNIDKILRFLSKAQ